jgi:hypothetical protein
MQAFHLHLVRNHQDLHIPFGRLPDEVLHETAHRRRRGRRSQGFAQAMLIMVGVSGPPTPGRNFSFKQGMTSVEDCVIAHQFERQRRIRAITIARQYFRPSFALRSGMSP